MKIDHLNLLSLKALRRSSRIAIIGNAGVTLADDRMVAQCDHVIRFNNFATRQGISNLSNPHRCDTLFTTFDLHSVGAKPMNVVIGVPYPFHVERIIQQFDKWYPSSVPYTLNPYWQFQMCQELQVNSEGWKHPFPSVGFTALWHLSKLGININSSVFVCGFNWYYDESSGLMQGYKLNRQPRPTHFNHDYWKESSWIVKNLLGKSGWTFSESCMRVLNKVKEAL